MFLLIQKQGVECLGNQEYLWWVPSTALPSHLLEVLLERSQNRCSPSLLNSIAVRTCGPSFWRKGEKVIGNKYRIIGFCHVSESKRANLAVLLITELRGKCRSALPRVKGFPVFLEMGDNQRKSWRSPAELGVTFLDFLPLRPLASASSSLFCKY